MKGIGGDLRRHGNGDGLKGQGGRREGDAEMRAEVWVFALDEFKDKVKVKGEGVDPICFFKQKTAYEVLSSLVGSEMSMRDSVVLHREKPHAQ